jgi:hypothetical protein
MNAGAWIHERHAGERQNLRVLTVVDQYTRECVALK